AVPATGPRARTRRAQAFDIQRGASGGRSSARSRAHRKYALRQTPVGCWPGPTIWWPGGSSHRRPSGGGHYLHDPADDTWIVAVQELLHRRAIHGLPPLRPQPRDLAHRVRAAVYGRLAFVPPARQRPGVWHRAFLRVGFWEHRRRWALRRLHGRDRDGVAPTSGSRA
ncbi:MAG: hypothetical protein ABW075_00830, partial [Aeromicrobium sp.]